MSLLSDLIEAARCCGREHSACSDWSPETMGSNACFSCGHGRSCHSTERVALSARLRSHAEADYEGQVAALRAKLDEAKRALTEIAEEGIDWAMGTGDNVGKLQAIADRALSALETP